MIHCSSQSFARIFSHISAHQVDNGNFDDLSRPAQLNCAVNFDAKRALLSLNADDLPRQQPFPLETVNVWAGNEKLTSDTGHCIRFHAHLRLAREEFDSAGIFTNSQFDKVDWEIVHRTLTTVPWMFQVWACKKVWSIAGTNRDLLRWSDTNPLCPSCMQVPETCCHILHCTHEGRVEALLTTITLLDKWLKGNDTDPDLRECIYEYAMGRGGVLIETICQDHGYNKRYN